MKIKKTMYTIVDANNPCRYPDKNFHWHCASTFSPTSSKLFADFETAKRSVAGLKRYGEYKILEVEIEWEVKQ